MEEGTESELISDNFTCAVCLDVLYKPIVLVCGHVSCFWCCQHSMHMRSESHCPLCRNPYHHFPAICHTFHFLLKKLYPLSYQRRNLQTLEDEKDNAFGFSPDIDSLVTIEEANNVGQSSDPSSEDDSSLDPSSSKKKKLNESSAGTSKQVSVSDVLCVACKELLFRPVVLNCGHVYCETCITIPADGMLKCHVCESRHPSGLPKVCRELDHFLEEQFSSEYALRRNNIQHNQEQTQNTTPNEASTQVSVHSFPTKENFLQWWTDHGSKIHDGVGCDMCGICPIIGDRYRCKDCTETCGYDLCGDCYISGSKLPGRFSQKHLPTHHLELVKPTISRNVIYRLLSGQMAVVSSVASPHQPTPVNGSSDLPSLEDDGAVVDSTESSSASVEDQSEN